MLTTELDAEFIAKLKSMAVKPDEDFNFFELGGAGYLENPTSDLLALFMGNQKMVPPWLLKALLCCLDENLDVDELDFTSLSVLREARTEDGKYLDILIRHEAFVLGLEHKVYADTYNPFPSYVNLIASHAEHRQKSYRCILKPDGNTAKGSDGWQLINYSTLVEKASQRLGLEMMKTPLSKWTVFYQEFLSHLKKLSEGSMNKVSDQHVEFVTENFSALIKANQLLEMYQKAIAEEAKYIVSSVFPDTQVTAKAASLSDNYTAVYLMPACWGQGNTGLSVVYRPATDGRNEAEFYVDSWIYADDYPDIHGLKEEVQLALSQGDFIPSAGTEDYEVSLSRRGQQLDLSFWGRTHSKNDAMLLLKEMAKWVDSKIRAQ